MRTALAAIATALFTTAATANLIEQDLDTPGDGLLTLDTETGFLWLDLTETTGISWNDIQPLLGPGQPYEGFRHATIEEAAQLYLNAGILEQSWTFGYQAEIQNLLDLMGVTFTQNTGGLDRVGARGISSTAVNLSGTPARSAGEHFVTNTPTDPGDGLASAPGGSIIDTFGSPTWGHFLILEQAPPCDGDANADQTIDVNDISFVLFRMGNPCPAPGCEGDANLDGTIDVNDISYVLFRLGNPC